LPEHHSEQTFDVKFECGFGRGGLGGNGC